MEKLSLDRHHMQTMIMSYFTLYRDLCRSLDSGFLNKREESAMPEHQGLRIAAKARVSRFPIHCLDLERN